MDIRFLMPRNIFLQEYFKMIWYLYQLKYKLHFLMALLEFILGNLMEYEKKEVLQIQLNQTVFFAPTFVNHYVTRCKL